MHGLEDNGVILDGDSLFIEVLALLHQLWSHVVNISKIGNGHSNGLDGTGANLQKCWIGEQFFLFLVFGVIHAHDVWLDLEDVFGEDSTDVELTLFEKLGPSLCCDLDVFIGDTVIFDNWLNYLVFITKNSKIIVDFTFVVLLGFVVGGVVIDFLLEDKSIFVITHVVVPHGSSHGFELS